MRIFASGVASEFTMTFVIDENYLAITAIVTVNFVVNLNLSNKSFVYLSCCHAAYAFYEAMDFPKNPVAATSQQLKFGLADRLSVQ